MGSLLVLGAGGEHRLDLEARPREFRDGTVDFRALLLEARDAFLEFGEGDLELRASPVAEIVEVEHLAHLFEREADTLAHQHVAQPRAVAPAVEPLLAVAARREQTLLLIEAQRPRAHLELPREVADGEDLTAGGAPIEAGHQIGVTALRLDNPAGGLELGHGG